MPARVTQEYRTSDLALASVLSMAGLTFRLERIDNGDKAEFIFKPLTANEAEDLEITVARFQEGSARVEPLRFMKEVRVVRDRLYNFLDGRGS